MLNENDLFLIGIRYSPHRIYILYQRDRYLHRSTREEDSDTKSRQRVDTWLQENKEFLSPVPSGERKRIGDPSASRGSREGEGEGGTDMLLVGGEMKAAAKKKERPTLREGGGGRRKGNEKKELSFIAQDSGKVEEGGRGRRLMMHRAKKRAKGEGEGEGEGGGELG